jgi:hypothetical protein
VLSSDEKWWEQGQGREIAKKVKAEEKEQFR